MSELHKLRSRANFQQYLVKHHQALLPNSIYSSNYLVEIPYYISRYKEQQLQIINRKVNEYIDYFLSNIAEIESKLDKPLNRYYENDFGQIIENNNYQQNNLLFSRNDIAFDQSQAPKLLEININKPTTFSEQLFANQQLNQDSLKKSIDSYFNQFKKPVTIAFVVVPEEYDAEASFLIIKRLISNFNVTLELVNYHNIIVEDERVSIFKSGKYIDKAIFFIPFEEVLTDQKFNQLLRLHKEHKFELINDPISMLVQNKGFFEISTELSTNNLIDDKYKQIIEQYIPYTVRVTKDNLKQIINEKDQYIFKPLNGRCSEGIFTGLVHTREDIEKFFLKEQQAYIAQQLIEIESEQVPKITYDIPTYEQAYIVYGGFSVKLEYSHSITRVSSQLITNDQAWSVPIVPIDKREQTVIQTKPNLRLTVNQKATLAVRYGFNGFNLNNSDYITNQQIQISSQTYNELQFVAKTYNQLAIKIQHHLISNYEKYRSVIDIDQSYWQRTSNIASIISRVDLVITTDNKIKVLESNIETPAGLKESFTVWPYLANDDLITSQVEADLLQLRQTLRKRIKELRSRTKTIAVISLEYYEDRYNTDVIYQQLLRVVKEDQLELTVIRCYINDLRITDGYLTNHLGQKIDAIYRYFPLDWFETYNQNKKVLREIGILLRNREVESLTPNESILIQHKALSALSHHLVKHSNIFSQSEIEFIERYIPFSATSRKYFLQVADSHKPYLTKSVLGREGNGIFVNKQYYKDVIFQEMENVQTVNFKVSRASHEQKLTSGFPVYGVYLTDDQPCGMYTRIGQQITDGEAYYLPVITK